ncbi:tetratricopeptide repeat protein [Ferruginibacter sp.]
MKPIKLFLTVSCVFLFAVCFSQQVKTKISKPVAGAKIDYQKIKEDITNLYRAEKYTAVITKATPYLLKFPKDTAITFQKAISHITLKQYPQAFNLLKKLYINIDTAAKYIALTGFSVPEKDIFTSGIACANEAIKINPNGPYGYFVKGGIYSDSGFHEKALPLMEKMFMFCRNDEEKRILGYFYPKELALNKQSTKAITAVNDLYVNYPKEKEIIYTYAFIYNKDEQYDKAIEKYDELITLFPEQLEFQYDRITAYDAWGKTAEACTETELLIAKDNGYDFLRYRYKCPAYFAVPAIKDIKTITWSVNSYGGNYNFKVTNLTGNATDSLVFDWLMTSGPNMNGHITITKQALEKATAQNNNFGPDLKNATLTDKTTVWISKAVFNELTKKGSCKIDVGAGEEIFTAVTDVAGKRDEESFDLKIPINGSVKYLNTFHIKNAAGSRQLWILNDIQNPMIVKMDIGFLLSLKSID